MNGISDDTTDPPGGEPIFGPRQAVAVAIGLGLSMLYWRFEQGLPRGPAEFAFWPALEPLPFAAIRGWTYEEWMRALGRALILGPGLLFLSWGLAGRRRHLAVTLSPGVAAFAAAGIGLAFGVWFQLAVLQGRALVDDELTYAWQAELLADGRLADDRLARWAPENFTIWTEIGATGKYLFGEPLIQAPGVALGIPAILHLPLLAIACMLWFRTVSAVTGPRVAAVATACLALSPMVLLVSATGLSHATSLFAMVLMSWGLVDSRRSSASGGSGWRGAWVAGSALGFAATVRPQVAVSFGVVLGACLLLDAWGRRRWQAAVAFLGAGLPWAVALLAYNHVLTGSALTLPWSLAAPEEIYGFGQVLEGSDYVHTPWRAVENLGMAALRLNSFLLGWPLSLGLLAIWWRVGRPTQGAAPWLLAGLGQIVFHLGYYTPGISGFGALYHLELVLPLSLLGGHAIVTAHARRSRLVATALGLHMTIGTGSFLAEQSARLDRMVSMIHDQPDTVLAAIDPPALLIYEAWPSESVHLGWIGAGFPSRMRGDRAAVVAYPRSGPESVRSLRAYYADRACWYSRVDPATFRPDLRRCAAAEDLLARPFALDGPRIAVRPTAMTRGLLPPPGDDP